MASPHELETGREWVKVARAAELVQRDRRTVYRWLRAGYVRTDTLRGKTYINLADAFEVEADIVGGRVPAVRVDNHS